MHLRRLVIIGAGAVGGSIGALLHQANRNVLVVARGSHGAVIRQKGLTLKLPDQTLVSDLPTVESVDDINWLPGDAVLLATKLQNAQPVLTHLATLPVMTHVACATNGIHAEKWSRENGLDTLSIVVWMPALYLTPGEVQLYCQGRRGVLDLGPELGPQNAIPRQLAEWFRAAGFDSQVRNDIDRWKRGKWISNLANAAQALILDDWKSIAEIAREEGKRVLNAAQLDFAKHDEMQERCKDVVVGAIDEQDRPGGSTWQSLQRGQPLESIWIEGGMVELGREVGVDTPALELLVELAQKREKVASHVVLRRLEVSPD